MIITIPFKTPSINHLYGQNGVRKYLKPEAKKLRQEIIEIVKSYPGDIHLSNHLKVTVDLYENWYTKKGTVKRVDAANREKFLIDSVFEGLLLDDKYIFEHTMRKIQSDEEKAVIAIEVLK